MSASKKPNPFLKKAAGAKPPTRREMKHGLGRGLSELIAPPVSADAAPVVPDVPVAAPAPAPLPGETILKVPPLDIERSPFQPRTEFDEEKLNELADSIRASGVIQPLVCRLRADGKLELIAGERRLRASVIAGVKLVPVTVKEADDATACTMTVAENAQRDDLNPIDEAEGYRLLIDRFGFTQADVAERVGKSRPVVANATRLLELPDEVRELVKKRHLSAGHAKVLLSVENEKDRILLAREAVTASFTVRDLERKIARLSAVPVERKKGVPDIPESYARQLAEEIHKTLGCAVRLTSGMTHANGKHTKGVLEIDFLDNDDLDRILAMIGVKMD